VLHFRKISRFIVPVLLVIVFCYAANATMNQHYHKLSSGLILNHAHPYDKGDIGDPFQEHQHTTSEYVSLEQISNPVFWIGLVLFLLAPFLLFEIRSFSPLIITFKKTNLYYLKNYRAPPVSSY